MSEAEWLKQTEARSMLALAARWWLCSLCHNTRRQAMRSSEPCWACAGSPHDSPLTPRKLRLIACALCRFLGEELTGAPAHVAVAVAERFAEGQATSDELVRARQTATAAAARAAAARDPWDAARLALDETLLRLALVHEQEQALALHAELTQVLINAEARCGHLGRSAIKTARKASERRIRSHFAEQHDRARAADSRQLCGVLLDILGNPFQPVRIDSAWLAADGGRVRQIAAGIEQGGHFGEMAVLADLLQDAGCTEAHLIDHCLQEGHYRGCWLLDALLGKR